VKAHWEFRITFWKCVFVVDSSLDGLVFGALPIFLEVVVKEHPKEVSVEVYRIVYELELLN